MRRPWPRVLELRERADHAQLRADAAVHPIERREAEARAGAVELLAPAPQPTVRGPLERAPQAPAHRRARPACPERVGRETGLAGRVYVRHERRGRHALELAGQRGGEREDVGDDRVRPRLGHQRARLGRGAHRGDVGLQRPRRGGEDLVFGRRGESHSRRLDVLAPPAPGLQHDLVAARRERPPERDHREGMAGVAEGSEQDSASSSVYRFGDPLLGYVNSWEVLPGVTRHAVRMRLSEAPRTAAPRLAHRAPENTLAWGRAYVEEIHMMDSAVGPPEQGYATPEKTAAGPHADAAAQADLVLATTSAA